MPRPPVILVSLWTSLRGMIERQPGMALGLLGVLVLIIGVGIGVGLGSLVEPLPQRTQVEQEPGPRTFHPPEFLKRRDLPLLSEPDAPEGQESPLPPESRVAPTREAPAAQPQEPPRPERLSEGGGAPPLPAISGPEAETLPPWRAHAVPAPDPEGRAMVAIVMDDLGIDRRRSDRTLELPGPLTAAYLTYADDLQAQTEAARRAGHELILHVAMEPESDAVDPGPEVLLVEALPEETRALLTELLDRVEGLVGINNHMGSRYTADAAAMDLVMEELARRGLLFLDSRTSPQSVGEETARRHGVPFAERRIFLDNLNSVSYVMNRLRELEEAAHATGAAVAIGHPRDATIEALREWLPTLEEKGLVLVPLTAIVKHRMGMAITTAEAADTRQERR